MQTKIRMSLVLAVLAESILDASKKIEALENQENGNHAIPTIEVQNGNQEASCKEGSKEITSEKSCEEASCKEEKPKEVKKTSKAKKKEEEVQPKEIVNVPVQRELTFEIVRAECKKVIDEKGRAALAELLLSFGATKTSELKPEQFEEVFQKCQSTLGAGNEF